MAYLLLTNPADSDVSEIALALAHAKTVQGHWSTGSRKQIPIGSLVLMVRVGTDPRGIIGYGTTISPVRINRQHWNGEHKRIANFVDIIFERLVDADETPELVLTIKNLHASGLGHVLWTPRGSGNEIADRDAQLAIQIFNDKLVESTAWDPAISAEDLTFAEGRRDKLSLHYRIERNAHLVRLKKDHVLRRTGELACEICGFSFEEVYGQGLKNFAECHHIIPLRNLTEGTRTRLSDLVIVDANCHRALHHGFTVEKLCSLFAHRSSHAKPPPIKIEFFFEPWFSYRAEGTLLSTIEPQATRWGQQVYWQVAQHLRSAREKRVPTNIVLLKHNSTNLEAEGQPIGIMLALIVSWSGGETEIKQIVEVTRLSELERRYQEFKQTLEKRYRQTGSPLV